MTVLTATIASGDQLAARPTPVEPLDVLARRGLITHQRYTCRRCRRLADAYTWGPVTAVPRGLNSLLGRCAAWPPVWA